MKLIRIESNKKDEVLLTNYNLIKSLQEYFDTLSGKDQYIRLTASDLTPNIDLVTLGDKPESTVIWRTVQEQNEEEVVKYWYGSKQSSISALPDLVGYTKVFKNVKIL